MERINKYTYFLLRGEQFPKQEVEQFFRTYRIRQFAVSKDESVLVFSSDMSGKPNLWAMDLPQTFPYPITYHDQDAGFINSVPEHWKPIMKRWVGDPVEDKDRLTKDSPTTYLDSMVKPLLVIQGANDPRVVKEESDQIVVALKEKGVHVEYLVLEDEGHGFSKKENEIKVNRLILDFLERHK